MTPYYLVITVSTPSSCHFYRIVPCYLFMLSHNEDSRLVELFTRSYLLRKLRQQKEVCQSVRLIKGPGFFCFQRTLEILETLWIKK